MSTVEEAWSRIIDWCRSNQPEAVSNLRAGATTDAIGVAESAMGVQFPKDLKALYELADGSETDFPGQFDDGHWFMPLAQATEHYQTMIGFVDEQPVDAFDFWRSQIEDNIICVKGPVKPHIFSGQWIPLTTSEGSVHRYVDLDPAPGGKVGQVIESYPEACSHQVLADSLGDYLAQFADNLESGRFVMEYGSLVDRDVEDSPDWGVPDYMLQDNAVETPKEPGPGEIELTGEMGVLAGTGDETFFTLHLDDGSEPAFLATRKGTKGFSTIAVQQRATVRAIHFDKRPTFFETPDYEVLEYRMIGS